MKKLKKLEKKYAELGKEIEQLKNKVEYYYDMYNDVIFKVNFSTKIGRAVKQSTICSVDLREFDCTVLDFSLSHFEKLEVCEKTGLFDGQLVWAWDEGYTHTRILRFYDVKNNTTFTYHGKRDGCTYSKYEAYEREYPQWALEAFKTLVR